MISKYLFSQKYYDEKKTKPILQLKILNELTKHKSLSKYKIRKLLRIHHYAEISRAIDSLKTKKLVRLTNIDQNGKIQPAKYYDITDDGVACIICEESNPKNFWSCVIRVCHHRSDPINFQTMNELYELFISKYLKYTSGREAVLYLDKLNNVFDKWLNIQKEIIDGDPSSKVIEVLAINSNITSKEICSQTGLNFFEVNEVLDHFSGASSIYYNPKTLKVHAKHYNDYLEQSFIKRSIIIGTQKENGKMVYALSLFGILLFLTILLQRTSEEPNIIANYYDKIALSYSNILPLILGKWDLLKDKLKYDSLFNFDVVLKKDVRSRATSYSVILYSYKELYQNACSIINYNIYNLKRISEDGINIIREYLDNRLVDTVEDNLKRKKELLIRTEPVAKKVLEGLDLVDYLKFDRDKIFQKYLKWVNNEYEISPIERICSLVVEEIYLTYYLNLVSNSLHCTNEHYLMYLSSEFSLKSQIKRIPNPAKQLLQILINDREISEWFYNWKKDILDFQNLIKEKIIEEPERISRYVDYYRSTE